MSTRNDLPDLDDLIRRVRNCKYTYREIAERSGLSYDQVAKFANGRKRNPCYDTLRKLLGALKDADRLPGRFVRRTPQKA